MFDPAKFLSNLFFWLLDGVLSLLDTALGVIPISCPFEQYIADVNGFPAVVVSWIQYLIPVSFIGDYIGFFVILYVFALIWRVVTSYLVRIRASG